MKTKPLLAVILIKGWVWGYVNADGTVAQSQLLERETPATPAITSQDI